ncbi:hypothetical protein B1813_18815 [Saccharomonospora piscinae]|uniref:Site-specific recombinase, DNA invertase Pin n=1 Tax=Saccharomonospora piscinae TaxID=687388 RepID=A0A1V8ZYB4_SACPI|nr:recombinase family protein [Saccharomonospora piscinae]OQO89895.1 hypothetical protein B1813_18815 [Saccharomonospora piscinae]
MAQTTQGGIRFYLRVSTDTSGREKSPHEQSDDLARDAEHQQWTVHPDPYRDVGSASRYARGTRDGYERLVDDLRADRFGAGILGLWESSRGSRRVGEWAVLLDLLEDRGVRVWVHTHGRLYDPANGRDRRTMLEDAVDSEYESSKTSERLRRDAAALAREGRPTGRIPYGYERVYDVRGGKRVIVEQRPHPVEAEHVRELYRRLLAGDTFLAIEEDWARRGITTRYGKRWTNTHLASLALSPTNAGLRLHAPGARGRRHMGMGTVTKGQWPPLVDEADFLTVQRMLRDPARRTWRPGGARHWLSRIAVCGPCGRPLTVIERRGADRYRCGRGCVLVRKDQLDGWVESVLLEYLARPDVHAAISAHRSGADDELARLDTEIARLRLEMAEAERSDPESVHEARILAKLVERLAGQITDLEARQAELSTPSVLHGLVGEGAADRWAATDIHVRREVARAVFSPEWLGVVRVMRSATRGRHRVPAPVSDRVVFDRG